ncbi:hypothetical protein [Methylobacter sp.]|uniref:hypothetical protein n=1 Tax=Methylobacter sp. TaxID=2051955 RepID=UPI003DA68043
MSQANLRNIAGNPFLYLETASGSTAIGTDASGADDIVKIVTGLTSSIDPTSADGEISIETTTPGDISFRPKGIGQSTFVNGDVEIQGTGGTPGNLLMQDTTAAGLSGVIEFGGSRFIHNYGSSNANVFVGETAGNFSTVSSNNIGIGTNALLAVTNGNSNVCIGNESGIAIQGGASNCAMGNVSLHALTSGSSNTSIGSQSLSVCTTGSSNVAIGSSVGTSLLTGSLNTLIGTNSGSSYNGAESSNILIKNTGVNGESNAIHIGTQGSGSGQQNKAFVAGVASTAITATGVVGVSSTGQLGGSNGSNGQVLVGGGTGPVWANITSTGGTVTVSNGANTINLETVTSGTAWSVITGDQTAVVNNGYICNKGSALLLALPTTAAAGTTLEVTGINTALGWKITQAAGQQIFFGSTSTTSGATGFLQSTAIRDSVKLVCVVANLTWNVISSIGNITVS